VAHIYNPSTQEAKAGILFGDQPGLETSCLKKQKEKEEDKDGMGGRRRKMKKNLGLEMFAYDHIYS
jgi:hypothetical protein